MDDYSLSYTSDDVTIDWHLGKLIFVPFYFFRVLKR